MKPLYPLQAIIRRAATLTLGGGVAKNRVSSRLDADWAALVAERSRPQPVASSQRIPQLATGDWRLPSQGMPVAASFLLGFHGAAHSRQPGVEVRDDSGDTFPLRTHAQERLLEVEVERHGSGKLEG